MAAEIDSAAEAAPTTTVTRKFDPETLVLRGRPASAIRFKRGMIVSLAAVAATGVVGTAWIALKPTALHLVAGDDEQTRPAKAPSDALGSLPTNYGDAPKLGPPLPGDLGKPILDRQRELSGQPPLPVTTPSIDPAQTERDRRLAELKTARESGLLFQTSTRTSIATVSPNVAAASVAASDNGDQTQKIVFDPDRDPNSQQRKADFLRTEDRSANTNPYTMTPAPSPFTLSAGTVIAASLVTGLRSDLPGFVTAQVTERVFDSATGRILLIPQGARLIGTYDSVVAFGQKRALVVWRRIVMPDGSSVQIDNMPVTDPSGYAGLEDKVDFHTWQLIKGVALSTLLGVSSELALTGDSDLVEALRRSTQDNVSRAGDQITMRNLNIQPTIAIRPGAPVRLLVNKDLVLTPWHEVGR